jgi:hypothetical protein
MATWRLEATHVRQCHLVPYNIKKNVDYDGTFDADAIASFCGPSPTFSER